VRVLRSPRRSAPAPLVRLEIQGRYGAFYPRPGSGRYVGLVIYHPRNGFGSDTCQRRNVTDRRPRSGGRSGEAVLTSMSPFRFAAYPDINSLIYRH
jgi:hypothetical protein